MKKSVKHGSALLARTQTKWICNWHCFHSPKDSKHMMGTGPGNNIPKMNIKVLPYIMLFKRHTHTAHTAQWPCRWKCDFPFLSFFSSLILFCWFAHVAIRMDRKTANHRVVKENTTNEMSTNTRYVYVRVSSVFAQNKQLKQNTLLVSVIWELTPKTHTHTLAIKL